MTILRVIIAAGDLDENGKFIPKVVAQRDKTGTNLGRSHLSDIVRNITHRTKHAFMEEMVWRRNNGLLE